MSKKCQVTGKKPVAGRSYAIRGIAKKKKGIGLNITGITNRRFLPNLFKKRFWFAEENRFITLRLAAKAMRTIEKKGLAAVVREMRAKGQKI
jgi:large subunit ribosomal protein L28